MADGLRQYILGLVESVTRAMMDIRSLSSLQLAVSKNCLRYQELKAKCACFGQTRS